MYPWKMVFDSWVFLFPLGSDACASVVDHVVSFLVGQFGAQKWFCLGTLELIYRDLSPNLSCLP